MTIPKPNGDVLRKIEQVKDDCSREFSQRNFASAYYIDEQTKEFLAELEKNHESVVFTERGVHGGTYGGKFVAYDYAAWLNPGFKYAAYKVLDDYFTGELQHRNSLSAQLNMKCHEFDQKKDMASFCGQGLAAWRYTKPVLVAEINTLANQLQITIPGLPG
ncbi:KilA-N domain-containing protein [Escherichia coli]